MKVRTKIAILTIAAIALSACGGSTRESPDTAADAGGPGVPEPATVEILVGQTAWSPALFYWPVAEQQGFFEEEGITPNYTMINGTLDAVKQLALGRGDLSFAGPDEVGSVNLTGAELEIYYMLYRRNHFSLAVPAQNTDAIQTTADFEGMRVGVVSLASATYAWGRVLLQNAGVDPDSVEWVPIGLGADGANAVNTGQVDALAMSDSIYSTYETLGIELEYMPSDLGDIQASGLIASAEQIEENRDVLVRVARAVAKATVFAEANPEQAVRDLWAAHPEARPAGVPEDEAVANTLHGVTTRQAIMAKESPDVQWGYIVPEFMQQFQDSYVSNQSHLEGVDVTEVYTNDLIDDINDFDAEEVLE